MSGYVPIANYAEVGAVKPDGATVDIAPDGTISVDASVTEAPPHLELTDGITDVGRVSKITVSHMEVGGTSDAATLAPVLATTVNPGIMQPDGATLYVDQNGIENAVTATAANLGVVQPDGTSIDISPGGVISVPKATPTTLGIIQPDDATIVVAPSGVIHAATATTSDAGVVIPDGTTIHVTGGGVISAVNQGVSVTDGTHTVAGATSIDVADATVSGSTPNAIITPKTATTSQAGIVQPDGSSIDIAAGVISAAIATGATLGIVQPDNTTINIDGGGVISVPIMSGTTAGLAKPDGTSIVASAPGVLTVPLATTSSPGEVQPDGTTIHVTGGGVISAAPGGVSVTDGTHTVAGATSIDFADATVSGTTPNATVTPKTATTSQLGIVKADGSTIDVATDGTLSVDPSLLNGPPNLELTDGTNDVMQVSKITTAHMVVGGTPTAATLAPALATTAAPGITQPDGTTIDVAAGVITAATATCGTLGVSRPDCTTIYIDDSGVLHVGSGVAHVDIVSDTTAKSLQLWNGSGNNTPPSNWQQLSFDDSAWSIPTDTGAQGGTFGAARDIAAYNPAPSTSVQELFRQKFLIPVGTYLSASLQLDIADTSYGVWINGTFLAGSSGSSGAHFVTTISVPLSVLTIGGENEFALHAGGADDTISAASCAVAWDLTLTHNAVTEPGAMTVSHNGGLVGTEQDINFIDGANVTLTVSDDSAHGRINVTIASSGGGGGGGGGGNYLCIVDQKSSGTNGGDFNSGGWHTRDLNTTIADTGGISSLTSNQITLPAGDYEIWASAPAWAVNRHQARLQNITASTTLLKGSSEYCNTGSQSRSTIAGKFTLASTSALEIQHQCATSSGSTGFGIATGTSFTVAEETYTIVVITQLGTGGGGGSSLTVEDGTTTVSAVTTIDVSGATVSDAGGGQANILIPEPVIFATELTGGAATIDFTSIPATARHLRVYGQVRSASTAGGTGVPWHLTFNGITTGYIFYETMLSPGNSPYTASNTGQAAIPLGGGESSPVAGYGGLPTGSNNAEYLSFVIDIPYYSITSVNKSASYEAMGAGHVWQNAVSVRGMANSVSAVINRLTFATDDASDFSAGSRIIVYGIN